MSATQRVSGFRQALLTLGGIRAFAAATQRYPAEPLSAMAPLAQADAAPRAHPATPGRLNGHWELGDDGYLCQRWRVMGDAQLD